MATHYEKLPTDSDTGKDKDLTASTEHVSAGISKEGETENKTCIPCSTCYTSKRYLTIVLVFIGMVSLHSMRVNISVTVVTILGEDPYAKVENVDLPSVQWTSQMVGILHSIFYLGYMLTQLPSGLLITKGNIAGHRVFGATILLSSCLNLLLPVSIEDVGFVMTCTIRLLQGLVEGCVFPSMYDILRHWTTKEERGRLGGLAITGVYAGAILGYPIAGLLTHFVSWGSVYYISGGFGIFWFVFWFIFAYEKPSDHPTISPEELENFKQQVNGDSASFENEQVPWKSIFTSIPLMATAVCHFARSWVFYLLLTNEPTYFNIFGFSVAENGILSSLPHVLMVIFSGGSGPIADYLMRHSNLSLTTVRKIMNTLGFGVECCCLFSLGFINDGRLAVAFLSIGAGFSGLCVSGWQINHLDLAPRYSSILISITSTFGVIAGVASPIIIGAITTHQTLEEWHTVFLITSGILLSAVFTFLIFGSGERQGWADPRDDNDRILITPDPFEEKPYGTFQQQYQFSDKQTQFLPFAQKDSDDNSQTKTEEITPTNKVDADDETNIDNHSSSEQSTPRRMRVSDAGMEETDLLEE